MAQQWDIQASAGRCCVTDRPFAEGEEFYTVLLEQGDTFTRADFSLEAWKGPPDGAYCHFKSRVPKKEEKKKLLVNNELLINFFERLADETERVRVQFRFVLALILMRKRLLRYDGSAQSGGADVWTMTLMRDRKTHRVVNPMLADHEIDAVSQELTAILHTDVLPQTTVDDATEEPQPDSTAQATP